MAREQRRLAAIVAADVVGYSRLMGRDESGTLARLREHRQQRLEPTLARHGGRLVKLTGDGALVEFPSAVDALSAAIEFQQAMAEANRDQPEDTAIVFRIGLHLGDLIVDGDDLYGDGVNVAARLEAEAPPGGIVISRAVHEAVDWSAEGRTSATWANSRSRTSSGRCGPFGSSGTRPTGRPRRPLRPRRCDRHACADAPLALPDKPSIAVLPFQNMSGDPEQEYFADGMVEDIITALSRFKSLFVIARNSSFTYKGKSVDIKQVGRELGVRYVLEGSVRKAGEPRAHHRRSSSTRRRAPTSGRNATTARSRTSSSCRTRVTASVVGAIAPRLDEAEIERARRKPIGKPDAYDLLSARPGASLVSRGIGRRDARDCLYRAIELDPAFAALHTHWRHAVTWFANGQGWIVDQRPGTGGNPPTGGASPRRPDDAGRWLLPG